MTAEDIKVLREHSDNMASLISELTTHIQSDKGFASDIPVKETLIEVKNWLKNEKIDLDDYIQFTEHSLYSNIRK